MKDRNYWLERGKNGAKLEGYICIGCGDKRNNLKDQLDVESIDLWLSLGDDFAPYNHGDTEDVLYYLTEQKFNELFPEKENMNYYIKPLNSEHSRAIQSRLFELGYEWCFSGKTIENYGSNPISLIVNKMEMQNTTVREAWKEITFDDLYKEGFAFVPIEVKLNSQYTAIVHKDKIKVGCQEFSMEVFEELKKAVDEVKEQA